MAFADRTRQPCPVVGFPLNISTAPSTKAGSPLAVSRSGSTQANSRCTLAPAQSKAYLRVGRFPTSDKDVTNQEDEGTFGHRPILPE